MQDPFLQALCFLLSSNKKNKQTNPTFSFSLYHSFTHSPWLRPAHSCIGSLTCSLTPPLSFPLTRTRTDRPPTLLLSLSVMDSHLQSCLRAQQTVAPIHSHTKEESNAECLPSFLDPSPFFLILNLPLILCTITKRLFHHWRSLHR